jgi:hypothetical protein
MDQIAGVESGPFVSIWLLAEWRALPAVQRL